MSDDAGVYRSRVLPGLWIDSKAFWAEDFHALLSALERGLGSRDHADFVARLLKASESAADQL